MYLRIFFMPFLPTRVGLGQNRPRLAEPKVQSTEQSLALAHAQLDAIFFLDP
jgi:hypothetical protein